MSKTTSIIIAGIIIVGAWYFVSFDSKATTNGPVKTTTNTPVQNTEIRDGIQYITITAQGGYSPKMSTAKAGIPTKLVIKTNGTYDCSSSLVIKSLNYRNMLPNTGETIIDAGTLTAGQTLQGVCGMGMYSFIIQFNA